MGRGRHAAQRAGRALARAFRRAIGVALKDQDDLAFLEPRLDYILEEAA